MFDSHEMTPMHLASERGIDGIVQCLIDNGYKSQVHSKNIGRWTPLHFAAVEGHLNITYLLLNAGANASDITDDNRTALHFAAERDRRELAILLIKRGLNVNEQSIRGWTPLHYAAFANNLNMTEILLKAGGNPNVRNTLGETTLHLAAEKGFINVVDALIKHGANVHEKSKNGQSPLHIAVENDHAGVVALLLPAGANINETDVDGWTSLHFAAKRGHVNLTHMLLERGANPNIKDNEGKTPLHFATDKDNTNILVALIKYGAHVNEKSNDMKTALQEAARYGFTNIVKILINVGANVDEVDKDGWTALHFGANRGFPKVVNSLIDGRANVTIKENEGFTALHYASHNGYAEIAKSLIQALKKKSANIDEKTNRGETALHLAVRYGHKNLVDILIEAGANIKAKNTDGESILDYAAYEGSEDVVNMLIKKGVDINEKDVDGWMALHYAARYGHENIVKILTMKNTHINEKDNDGWTALHFASNFGHINVTKVLLENGANITERDNVGNTPLHFAANKDEFNTTNLLLRWGANINDSSNIGWTALHAAASLGSEDTARLLIENGADIHAKDIIGQEPRDLALAKDHKNIVEILNSAAKKLIKSNDKWIIIGTSIALLIFALLSLIIVRLFLRGRLERQQLNELVDKFKKGDPSKINENLSLAEQSDLLPYDERFEFPEEYLILGKRLGAGAYGVVYEATARNILPSEKETRVAVKTAKSNIDFQIVEALAKELKLMTHLGRHINFVNLLGAVTKNFSKREIMVIVEYCPFGNIQFFLRKNYNNFIDQINRDTDTIDPTVSQIITSNYNQRYFVKRSSKIEQPGSSSVNTVSEFGIFNPQYDETNVSEDLELQSIENLRDPFTTTNLLCWAFQVTQGMQYLGSQKVVHGDLAARNILLCNDNVVKICDFGLAQSLSETYFCIKNGTSSQDALPMKWLAPETMKFLLFSPFSDVWSFGIVLWEFFSLGMEPYAGMDLQVLSFRSRIEDGYQMEKPDYATQDIYDLMRACWNLDPQKRPSFKNLEKRISMLLGHDMVKSFIEMNRIYLEQSEYRDACKVVEREMLKK